jgi:hypothetical protein
MYKYRRLAAALAVLLVLAWRGAAASPHPSLPAPGSLDGLGVNIHFTDPKPGEVEMIAAAGFKWVRTDMFWESIEKVKGKYDFSAYDPLVAALARARLRAVFVLDYGNRLYETPGDTDPYAKPEFREAFSRWAVATVGHYAGKGFLWEIWNEPNLPTFWKPQPSGASYAALVEATGMALRDAGLCKDNHSGEALIGPACSLADFPFLETCFKAGLLNYWCGVSLHPYRHKTPESVADDYRRLRALIATYAPGEQIPIISGEWGYSTAPPDPNFGEEKQAAFFTREMLTNITNDVPLSIWYDWRDDGDDPKNDEHHFGLVRRPYNEKGTPIYDPKPVYVAMQTLTRRLGGYTFNKRVSLPGLNNGSDVDIDLFSGGGETRIVAWRETSGEEQCALPVGNCVLQGVTALGEVLADQPVTAASPMVNLGDSPIYFRPTAPDPLLTLAANWQKAPLDVACDAPNKGEMRLNFSNPLSQPVTLRGMATALQPGAAVQTRSDPAAPSRMPPDRFGESDGHFRARHAYLDLLSPRCLLTQDFTVVVKNYVAVRVLPPGANFDLLEVANPSGEQWQGQARLLGPGGEAGEALPYPIAVPAGTKDQTFRLPVEGVSPKPGQRIQIAAEGGTLTLPIPAPMPWSDDLLVVAGGNPHVASTQSVSRATPPEGGPPSGGVTYLLKYQFDSGWKFLKIDPGRQLPTIPPIEGKPDGLGIWVNGDGQNCKFRARFQDSTGQTFQLDGTQLAFKGWQYAQMPFTGELLHWNGANDGQIHYPITWVYLLLDGTNGPVEGEVYFSAPVLIYSKDTASIPDSRQTTA